MPGFKKTWSHGLCHEEFLFVPRSPQGAQPPQGAQQLRLLSSYNTLDVLWIPTVLIVQTNIART